MRNRLIEGVETDHLRKNALKFEIGDTVKVSYRIREGNKERIQPFIGVVIARRGGGMNATFTVRRIVNNEGVERVFPVHSPFVVDVERIRSGKTRRAKLYFLRDRVGKARKLRERRVSIGGPEAEGATEESGGAAENTESGAALAGV